MEVKEEKKRGVPFYPHFIFPAPFSSPPQPLLSHRLFTPKISGHPPSTTGLRSFPPPVVFLSTTGTYRRCSPPSRRRAPPSAASAPPQTTSLAADRYNLFLFCDVLEQQSKLAVKFSFLSKNTQETIFFIKKPKKEKTYYRK
ncbi:hypothetical protein R6Q59_026460 [Mikania micrantha]